MPTTASYQVLLQYTPSSEVDISADVREIMIERRLANFRRQLEAGRAEVVLHNVYGRYTPTNSNTALSLTLNLGVQISGVASGSGGSVVLFKGTIDGYGVNINKPQTAAFRLSDIGKTLVERETFTKFHLKPSNVTSILNEALTTVGLAASQVSVTNLNDTRLYLGYGHQTAAEVIHDIIKTGGHLAFIARNGVVRVVPRYWDNSQSAITTYTSFYKFDYALSDENLINRINGRAEFLANAQPGSTIEIPLVVDPIPVPPSTFAPLTYADYIRSGEAIMMNSVIQANIFASTSEDGGLPATSQISNQGIAYATTIVISLYNNHSSLTAWVRSLAVQGFIYDVVAEGQRYRDCESSQNVYGVHEITLESRAWPSMSAALAYAEFLFSNYATPRPTISMSVRNEYPYVLTADLGNKISLVNTETGIDGQYTIYGIRDRITAADAGWIHETNYELERPPS